MKESGIASQFSLNEEESVLDVVLTGHPTAICNTKKETDQLRKLHLSKNKNDFSAIPSVWDFRTAKQGNSGKRNLIQLPTIL